MTVPTTAAAWTWPADVLAFAAEHDLTSHLDLVLDMTRRIFPERQLSAELTADYEIPDERYLTVWVDVTGLTMDQLGEQSNQWYTALRDICSRDRESWFYLGMEGK